jgi:PII-like signaling protein
MSTNCLKLTSYFSERQRTEDRFLAEALFDMYDEHELATSVMLRGVAGFGLRRHLRTDQSLSLSENPPVAVIAVDTKAKIEEVLDEQAALTNRGLITLERAQLLRDEGDDVVLEELQHEAAKLTIYVGRKERVYGVPAYHAVVDLLYRRGLAGASVFLGVDGTARGRRERARFFGRNVNVPMMIIAVDAGHQIGRVVPELRGLLRRPLITVERRVQLCKRDGRLFARPHSLPGVDEHGLAMWQKIMVYTSEAHRYGGLPIHRALIGRLRASEHTRGATVLRGVWGFDGDGAPQGDKFFQLGRRVPVTTIIVDVPENIARSFDIIDELTQEHGLVTCEMVPALLAIDGENRRGGMSLASHDD